MSEYTSGGVAFDDDEPWASAELKDVKHFAVWAGDELIAIGSDAPDAELMDLSWDAAGNIRVELHSGPRFPKAKVNMSEFMRVDAVFHVMLEACAQMRRRGATEDQITEYREEAINGNPWHVTRKWVATTTEGARNG